MKINDPGHLNPAEILWMSLSVNDLAAGVSIGETISIHHNFPWAVVRSNIEKITEKSLGP